MNQGQSNRAHGSARKTSHAAFKEKDTNLDLYPCVEQMVLIATQGIVMIDIGNMVPFFHT
eukprot:13700954-Ditylum_brightwellii.AAC.1